LADSNKTILHQLGVFPEEHLGTEVIENHIAPLWQVFLICRFVGNHQLLGFPHATQHQRLPFIRSIRTDTHVHFAGIRVQLKPLAHSENWIQRGCLHVIGPSGSKSAWHPLIRDAGTSGSALQN
jgi:hypothetical protein